MNGFDLRASYPGFRLAAAAAWDAPCAALFGASGSGKSTVLEALAGFRPEVTGSITLSGRPLEGVPAHERGIGWVPQDAALFPHMTVRANLEFARRGGARVEQAIAALEIAPLFERLPGELSGGERQRVALARALMSSPEFLLLDEPLASIDRPRRARLLPFLDRLPRETGIPVLLVTHDPLEVLALAQHVIIVENGAVVAQGDPRSVFASAAEFAPLQALGAENIFGVRVLARADEVIRLESEGGCQLEMASVAGFPDPRRVAVRAEDILLATRRPEGVSAQNILAGSVSGMEAVGARVLLRVAAGGETWVAKVTGRAARQLELAPGVAVWLLIKAHAIHPV